MHWSLQVLIGVTIMALFGADISAYVLGELAVAVEWFAAACKAALDLWYWMNLGWGHLGAALFFLGFAVLGALTGHDGNGPKPEMRDFRKDFAERNKRVH